MEGKPDQQLSPDDGLVIPPPYEFEVDPDVDPVAKQQEMEAELAASEAAAQEARDLAAEEIAANNDAAAKALDALRAGDPLQDEPI